MKRNYLLYILLAFTLWFSSCTDDNADSLNQGILTISDLNDTVIILPCIDGKDSISFTSTMSWSVDSSFANWLKLSTINGFGGRNIKIILEANNYCGSKKRDTEFKISIDNRDICIKVVQDSIVGFVKDKALLDTLVFSIQDTLAQSIIACSEDWECSFSREFITTDNLFTLKENTFGKNEFSQINLESNDTIYSSVVKKVYLISKNYLDSIVILKKGVFEGFGTSDSPFIISNAASLKWIKYMAQEEQTSGFYYKQTKNIDLAGNDSSQWDPITPFSGIYDGNNHTIKNLYINDTTKSYQGLFGVLSNASIKKIILYGSVAGKEHIGSICGNSNSSIIDSCISYCKIQGYTNVGGITGHSDYIISNCTNNNTINGFGYYIGGICGYSESIISNCANRSPVIGQETSNYNGGICGILKGSTASILNCYNADTVYSKEQYLGGIVGSNQGSKIYNCYNYRLVEKGGAIVGIADGGSQEACYALRRDTTNTYYLVGESKNGNIDKSEFFDIANIDTIRTTLNKNSETNGYIRWDIDTTGYPSFK